MSITLPAFTPIEESLFLTLCGRALDNRSPHPILADTLAGKIMGKLDYDVGRFHLSASPILNIALRAKKLDQVAQNFITRHPDAVGLDLGAGLDTRAFRINPPPTVDWYDVNRLTDHFPSGEVAFNGYSRFAIWAAKHYHGTQSVADLIKSPGFDDPHEPERWDPKLQLVNEILLTREPEVAQFPPALRLFTRLSAHSTTWSRRGTTVLQYRF
jgi:O-methyltransferase involved in polyketide biosynthesis